MSLTVRARCKVNLRLEVVGKRPDGYHELRTIFDRISLGDEVVVERSDSPGIRLTVSDPSIPAGSTNLVWRAAESALAEAGRRDGLKLHLEKRVPAGAGLGGGSSDAAATLLAVDELLSLGLGKATLSRLGRALGADVPFFVEGCRMAAAAGVGERLRTVSDPPELFYVLTNPGFEVSTAWAFQAGNFGLTPGTAGNEMVRSTEEVDGGSPHNLDDVLRSLRNDLEAVTASRHPEILELRQALLSAGALGARMSGSGPTVFGLFASRGDAERAADELERRYAGSKTKVFVARGE